MAGLKAIKTKIRSIQKTRKVTKAMEAVSAAKMRKAQSAALSARAYARAALSILARVSGSQALRNNPLTAERPIKKGLYLVITSDKGLAGALNSSVLRATLADIEALGLSRDDVSILAMGRKAHDFFVARGFTVAVYHPNLDDIPEELISELVNIAVARFTEGAADRVTIAYQNFISTFEQRPTLRVMFPLSVEELKKVVDAIVPAKGAFSGARGEFHPRNYTVEPSEDVVFAAILPRLAGIFVYYALLETKASEHSARMVSMKSASDKAEELTHAFTLQFNKARQAAITREVSEITGGMEAMAS